ncbi:MAG TPA: hypothetical protein VHC21_00520 [Candidatus Saccharimonadales bacterium]|nr:hypothetical protein [Candidatus Saccharimonadales bacterium]
MRFRYETGIVTLVQFIVLSLLSLANSLDSIISTCINHSSPCVENMIPSILLYILIAIWFAIVWILGYTAQERRTRKWAAILIVAEAVIALVALFSIKHNSGWLSMVTSSIDLVFALWVIVLAGRLFFSGGGRVVARGRTARARRRRHPPTTDL